MIKEISLPGEIIRINCACGVNGSISLGFSEAELFLRLRESDALPKTVFEYITIDKNLELVTLQSSVRFLPFSDYLIPIESLNGLISGSLEPSASTGGVNEDGLHQVAVVVEKIGSSPTTLNFAWEVNGTLEWVDKNENRN